MELNFLVCPYCQERLVSRDNQLHCQRDGKVFYCQDGIYRLLTKEREEFFRSFLEKYTLVRKNEGWGGNNMEYYMSLPYKDITGRNNSIWRIRAKTFDTAVRHLQQRLSLSDLNVLDIGAGNCWMTRYFSQWGNNVVAIDINLDENDGLKAGQVYINNLNLNFVRAQAEIESLPFTNEYFNLVIANGSFHYATSYDRAIREIKRVLKKNGIFIIIDSPTYTDPKSGMQMVAERAKQQERDYGIRHNTATADSSPTSQSGFLVHDEIEPLLNNCGFEVQILKPFHGILWTLRPVKAKILGSREPATFPVIIGKNLPSLKKNTP
ncbi:MAG: class I SAM-dependent methyltransferase [Candidatus Brocadiales bacterium]